MVLFRLVVEKRTKMVAVKRLGSADSVANGDNSVSDAIQDEFRPIDFASVIQPFRYICPNLLFHPSIPLLPSHLSPTCCHSLNKLSSIISAYPELIISLYGTNLNKSLEATEAQKPKALNQNSHVKLFKYLPLIWNYSEITRCLWIALLVLKWFGITKGGGVSVKARGVRCFPLKWNKLE